MGTLSILAPFAGSFLSAMPISGMSNNADDALLKKLLTANDQQVKQLLSIKATDPVFSRRTGMDIAVLAAAYTSPGSNYFHKEDLIKKLDELVKLLSTAQAEDGTVNIGNLESPPDTAFLLEHLSAGAYLMLKDNAADLKTINAELKNFLVKSGDALAKGGVHTPNHRWVVRAALARLNAL